MFLAGKGALKRRQFKERQFKVEVHHPLKTASVIGSLIMLEEPTSPVATRT